MKKSKKYKFSKRKVNKKKILRSKIKKRKLTKKNKNKKKKILKGGVDFFLLHLSMDQCNKKIEELKRIIETFIKVNDEININKKKIFYCHRSENNTKKHIDIYNEMYNFKFEILLNNLKNEKCSLEKSNNKITEKCKNMFDKLFFFNKDNFFDFYINLLKFFEDNNIIIDEVQIRVLELIVNNIEELKRIVFKDESRLSNFELNFDKIKTPIESLIFNLNILFEYLNNNKFNIAIDITKGEDSEESEDLDSEINEIIRKLKLIKENQNPKIQIIHLGNSEFEQLKEHMLDYEDINKLLNDTELTTFEDLKSDQKKTDLLTLFANNKEKTVFKFYTILLEFLNNHNINTVELIENFDKIIPNLKVIYENIYFLFEYSQTFDKIKLIMKKQLKNDHNNLVSKINEKIVQRESQEDSSGNEADF